MVDNVRGRYPLRCAVRVSVRSCGSAPITAVNSASINFGSEDLTVEEAFRSAWVAAVAAVDLWDDVHWDVLSQRHLDVVRKAGALSLLPLALASPRHLRHPQRQPGRRRISGRRKATG